MPLFSIFLAYVLLSLYFCTKQARSTKNSKFIYAASSLFDVTGLGTTVAAFQQTLLASVTLIMVSTLIVTTVLSLWWLRIQYFWNHYVALVLCAFGVFVTVYNDLRDAKGHWSFGNLSGDLLALLGALSYGVTSVISDYLLRHESNNFAITAHLGLFGSIFSLLALLALGELKTLASYSGPPSSVALFLCYAVCGFTIYSLAILLIKLSGATVFHLVALFATLFAMLYDTFLFNHNFVSYT